MAAKRYCSRLAARNKSAGTEIISWSSVWPHYFASDERQGGKDLHQSYGTLELSFRQERARAKFTTFTAANLTPVDKRHARLVLSIACKLD